MKRSKSTHSTYRNMRYKRGMENQPYNLLGRASFKGGLALTLTLLPAIMKAQEPADSLYNNLEEIVVTADIPVITNHDGKVNYNVSEDPSSTGSTLLDMLRKVPLITIDADENIKVNGNSDFKFLINGKEEPAFNQNAKLILKSMPANSVERIEVITEPGSKYDAEGCSALVNLITETSQRRDGYTANLSLDLSKQIESLSGLARMKYGKIIAGVNASVGTNTPFKNHSWADNSILLNNPDGTEASIMRSHAKQIQDFNFAMAGLNLSYEPDDRNLFTINVNYTGMGADIDYKEDYLLKDFNMGTQTSYDRILTGDVSVLNLSAGFNYQHTFADHHILSGAYLYSFGNQKMNLENDFSYKLPLPSSLYSTQNSNNITREQTIQADYSLPLSSEKHLFEAGAKGIFRNNTGFGNASEGNSPQAQNEVMASRVSLLQHQEIASAYASYTGHFGNLTAKGGLRFEHTETRIRDRVKENGYSSSLNDLVPSASLSYSISPLSQLRMSYQWSINRPSISELNPFEAVSFGGITQKGNPDLNSVDNHKVAVSYSNFGNVVGGSLTLQYTRTNGMISATYISTPNGIIQIPMNIGHSDTPELSAIFTWQIINRMSINFNGAVRYKDIRSNLNSNHGWEGNYGINWSYSLPSGYNFNAYGGQGTKSIGLQTTSSEWHYYGISVSKSLLADRSLTLSLNAMNFFEGRQSYLNIIELNQGESRRNWSASNWNVGVGISWNFGSIKSLEEKHTHHEILNDDVQKNSNSQGSSSIGI